LHHQEKHSGCELEIDGTGVDIEGGLAKKLRQISTPITDGLDERAICRRNRERRPYTSVNRGSEDVNSQRKKA
jgi:hypothetical protein